MTIRCPGCERDMDATASICRSCTGDLEISLGNVAAYHVDLDTLRSRQTRYGSSTSGTRSSGEHRLGMDLRFDTRGNGTAVEQDTKNTIVGWVRYVLDHVPPVIGPVCSGSCPHRSCTAIVQTEHPRDTIASCCAYLQRFADWLRVSAVGAEVLADVTRVERRLRRLVDRPPDDWYAGRCEAVTGDTGEPCGRELRALHKVGTVRCRGCGSTYDVATRRQALLLEAEDRMATVRLIITIVTTWGDPKVSEAKMEARINSWVSRDRLVSHGFRVVAGRPRPIYRVGDVLDLLGHGA